MANLINLEYGQPIALNQVTEIIEGRVNRAVLAKTEAARIVFMALDEGAELKPHPAPGDAIVQVIEGEIVFTLNDVPHRLRGGEAIVMEPGAIHAVTAVVPSKMAVTAITKA